MRYRCPSCKTVNMLDLDDQGTQIACGRCEAAITVPSDYNTPGVVFGDFVLVEKIVKRSHETDFRAEQISLKRDVILKIIKPELSGNKEFTKSFLDACRQAATLTHPFLCQVIGVGKENGTYYLAHETGGTRSLRDQLVSDGALQWKVAAKLTCEIAEALDHGWEQGQIRHLNVKPDYIIVDPHKHARLADIGLAGLNPKPGSDRIIGTPQYIAPERIVGMDGDNRSDLYSLGVTLFFMVTGQFPFLANDANEIIERQLNDMPRQARTIVPEVPEGLCMVIDMLLEKNPNLRYQSGKMLIFDLQEVINGNEPPNASRADDLVAPAVKVVEPPAAKVAGVTPAIALNETTTLRIATEGEKAAQIVETEPPEVTAMGNASANTNDGLDTTASDDDPFSDLDNLFADLETELEMTTAAEPESEPEFSMHTDEFNKIVANLTPQSKEVVPAAEAPAAIPVARAVPIARAEPVVEAEPSSLISPVPPAHLTDDHELASEVDALFDEELPPIAAPPIAAAPVKKTAFPSVSTPGGAAVPTARAVEIPAPSEVPPPASVAGVRKPKKKFKTRAGTKTKFNLRRK